MNSVLIFGIVLTTGFIMGELAQTIKLPKVTGYIVAGILLNPQLFHIVPQDVVDSTGIVTNIALSFITFSIGGTLCYSTLKKLGKNIISITICEAEFTFFIVFVGFLATIPYLIHFSHPTWLLTYIPISLLIGSIASPTDPTASLAVTHETNSKGNVTSTILSVGAFDDALGLMNYSIAFALTEVLLLHQQFNAYTSLVKPILVIVGSLVLGILFGFLLNIITTLIKRETEGVFAVIIFGLLAICYGLATVLKLDELLATMMMGIIVTNFNKQRERIFGFLERYTEEMIFVLFFSLSGMYLDFSVLGTTAVLVLLYAIFRTIGKFFGTFIGASISHAAPAIKKYTFFGLIPSGGIIVGLALILRANPAYKDIAGLIINTVIGATVVHELIGPIFVKLALKGSKEIGAGSKK
ncbi:MAG: sodium:proton exchanger [Deltaproteobacteria bacterium]|jgi:Kef-type K+ transport system membrane component KefB|nr:sodium:proton exchanger [Deltaproteobacteria bacterium]